MIIAPKVAEVDIRQTEDVQKYMNGTFEIQMLSQDLQMSWENCVSLMNNQSNIKEVILHTPFTRHVLEVYLMSRKLERSLIKLLIDCIKYSSKRDIKIGIIFHAEISTEFIESTCGDYFVKHILDLVEGTNVYILLENSLPVLSAFKSCDMPLVYMVDTLKNTSVQVCLDLCHLQATENCLKKEIILPEDVISRIREIHFSATLNCDGYINKKETHGRVHRDYESLKKDFIRIVNMGVNTSDLIMTAEISENNYRERTDMLKELEMLYRVKSEILI